MARGKKKLSNEEIYRQAIEIVKGEKTRWEPATAFITDRVSFKMRSLIRTLRKNYYGIFDKPNDEYTGLAKIWYPLTEIDVEAVVKNIDVDQKDLEFIAKTPEGYDITDVTRAAVKDALDKMYFGQRLDDFERQLAIDGTAVWKTWEENGQLRNALVDLLNIWIDPTSPSIQEAYRFTERALLDPAVIKRMDGWDNTDKIDEHVPEGLPRTDPFYANRGTMVSNVKAVDVYEMWGKIPKSLITGLRADEDQEVEGHIVVSHIDAPGNELCHLIEENTKKDNAGNILKPYEEAWYTRVPNRWYGRGIAEKLMELQVYANIVFNVRINRSRVSQLGLFKIKKGSGITPQMLSRLPANGAIVLNNMDDFEQLVVQEVGQSSYTDEEVVNKLAERLTNAFDVVTGENMPASTPATNAAIQNQNAKSGFSLIKDGVAGFLERWMDRHALAIIAKTLTAGQIVRISSTEANYKDLVDDMVLYKAHEALEKSFAAGYLPSPQELQQAIDDATRKMRSSHSFVTLARDVIDDQLYTRFTVGNEEVDINVNIQNLISMMSAAPQYADPIVKQVFDLMGLALPQAPQPQQPQGMPGQAPQGLQAPLGAPQPASQLAPQQLQRLTTAANTMQ